MLKSFTAIDLYQTLTTYWPVLFESTRVKKTGRTVTTFSDFTESYLLPMVSSSSAIRIVTMAVLRHLLMDMCYVSLELVMKLFMDYLAAHFGQMDAYLSAQSILENLLESYFYRLYVVRNYSDSLSSASDTAFIKNHLDHFALNGKYLSMSNNNNNNNNININDSLCSHLSSDSDKTNSSIATSTSESSLKNCNGDSFSMILNRNEMGSFANDDDGRKHPKYSSAFLSSAMKILIRIYLSALKVHSTTDQSSIHSNPATKTIHMKYIKFLRENFNKIYSNHVLLTQIDVKQTVNIDDTGPTREQMTKRNQCGIYFDTSSSIKLQPIPILFIERRPNYLNNIKPIAGTQCQGGDGDRQKILDTVLKMQSLLSSGKLTRDILQEIIHFVEANTPFIGVDSLLMLLMPFDLCIDYIIELCPENLLEYSKVSERDALAGR